MSKRNHTRLSFGAAMVSGIVLSIRDPKPIIEDLPDIPDEKLSRFDHSHDFARYRNIAKYSENNLKEMREKEKPKPKPASTNVNSSVKPDFSPQTILKPLPCGNSSSDNSVDITSSKSEDSSFLKDFDDKQIDDPFHNVELKSINDFEELKSVLQSMKPVAPDPQTKPNLPDDQNISSSCVERIEFPKINFAD